MGGEGIHNPLDDTEILDDVEDNHLHLAIIQAIVADIHTDLAEVEQEVYEVEKHLHGHEKWLGAAAVANGEIHVADRLGPGIVPFALLSGNNAYGNWLQVMGSSDSPIEADMTRMDAHRALVTTTDSTEAFCVQFVIGESADIAALIAAEDFTEFAYISATNNADAGITDVMSKRIVSGTKVWARCICIGQNAKTINLYVGVHEYLR